MTWLATVRENGLGPVVQALGLEIAPGGSLTPCPGCGAVTRGARDGRGPIGSRDAVGWRCFACGCQGGPVDLVALARFGERLVEGDTRWADLRRECEALGLTERRPDHLPGQALCRPTTYPPRAEVLDVWRRTVEVAGDRAVALWLRRRKIDVGAVQDRNLARAIPERADLPKWAGFGRDRGVSWTAAWARFRLALPMFDAAGEIRSLHVRALKTDAKTRQKSLMPKDHTTRGLVMANRLGQLVLSGRPDAVHMVSESSAGLAANGAVVPVGVVIAEGIPDFLTAATTWGVRPFPAVFGIVSGSWQPEIAERLPRGTRVLVATDNDKDGEKYAAEIARTLENRCEVFRWRAEGDVNEIGLAGGTVEQWKAKEAA